MKKRSSKSRSHKGINLRDGKYLGDGLINLISGLGTNKDKAVHNQMTYKSRPFDFPSWQSFYTEFWLARKVVDLPAKDMTREWRKMLSPSLSPKEIADFNKEEKRFKVRKHIREAVKWARLYGGSVIIPVFDVNQEMPMSEPLDINKIKKGSLAGFSVVDASLVYPSSHVSIDPTKPNYLLPETYSLSGSKEANIHHSWIIRVDGADLPRRERQIRRYWGQSIIDLLNKALLDALTSSDAGASLLHELNLDILSVKGLSNALASGQEKQIINRFETYAHLKSIWNLVVVDVDEQFNSRPLQFANLDKVIEKFYDLVAGATSMPVTKLLGQSARGLNATGEGDQKDYYDFISCEQEEVMEPPLDKIDAILSMNLWGKVPEDLTYEFVSLGQLTDKEQAEIENMRADRDTKYLTMGVITEVQVAKELMQNQTYDSIDDQFIKELEAAVKEAEEADDELIPGEQDANDPADPAEAKDPTKPAKEEE